MEEARGNVGGGSRLKSDRNAIGAATALFSFLLIAKFCLLGWNVFIKHRSPLGDTPLDGVLLIAGSDLLLCLGVAGIAFFLFELESAWQGRLRWPARVTRWLMLAGLVVFTVVSFEV